MKLMFDHCDISLINQSLRQSTERLETKFSVWKKKKKVLWKVIWFMIRSLWISKFDSRQICFQTYLGRTLLSKQMAEKTNAGVTDGAPLFELIYKYLLSTQQALLRKQRNEYSAKLNSGRKNHLQPSGLRCGILQAEMSSSAISILI